MPETQPTIFCKLSELAERLGLPEDFLLDEANRGTLCYVDLTPRLGDTRDDGTTIERNEHYWHFNVEIAAQEILHTKKLSKGAGLWPLVPGVE